MKSLFTLLFVLSIAFAFNQNDQEFLSANKVDEEEVICPDDSDTCYPLHFKAEAQFKPILPHQIVPSGLYYRMNFETGLNEAKLLESDDARSSDVALPMPNNEFSDIIERLEHSNSNKESLSILELLDTTEIDGLEEGRDLMNVGADLFRRFLDDATGKIDSKVKAKVASVIGQAVQNNPAAQNLALKSGLLESFLAELSASAIAHDMDLTLKYLYGLGSLIRSNANNLVVFYDFNGLIVLASVFDEYRHLNDTRGIMGRVEQLVCDFMNKDFYKEGEMLPKPDEQNLGAWCDSVKKIVDIGINWGEHCSFQSF